MSETAPNTAAVPPTPAGEQAPAAPTPGPATDPGTASTAGEQAPAAPTPAPAAEPGASSAIATQVGVIGHEANVEPKTVAAPQVSDPGLPKCPRCNVGCLYTIAYDADASHETGQPLFSPKLISGGAAIVHCFNCEHNFSIALAPDEAPPDPLAGRL